jgi:hypothetical protein
LRSSSPCVQSHRRLHHLPSLLHRSEHVVVAHRTGFEAASATNALALINLLNKLGCPNFGQGQNRGGAGGYGVWHSFFKTAKHQFGWHCFGQSTKLGVYRWLILSLIAYLLAHWIDQWTLPPMLDWKAASRLTLETLFPSIVWFQLLKQIRASADIAAHYGFEIVLKSLPDWVYKEWCKI